MGFNPFSGRSLIGLGTLGLSEAVGEDTMSKVPVLNALGGYQADSQKALEKKQQEMAEAMKKRQRHNEQMRLNALGQKMLAFNPQNQLMAQMFGPEAAFTPQQFAQMAADPAAAERAANWGKGTDEERENQVKDRDAEARRQAMIQQNMQPVPQGPAPFQQRAPQAARRRG
jgi:hypothetical protein